MLRNEELNEYLDQNFFITTCEARDIGINKMALSRLVQDGTIYRLERGVYAKEFDWLTDSLKRYVVPCTKYPSAVVAGIS